MHPPHVPVMMCHGAACLPVVGLGVVLRLGVVCDHDGTSVRDPRKCKEVECSLASSRVGVDGSAKLSSRNPFHLGDACNVELVCQVPFATKLAHCIPIPKIIP